MLEHYREIIEDLEDKIIDNPTKDEPSKIQHLKKEISLIRRYMLPLKEEMFKIKKEPGTFIQKETRTYLQDVYDHLQNLEANFETFREMVKDLMELYLGNMSNIMNQVMKTLTIVSAIFIPLTFLAGIYGMNFHHMPELKYTFSYPVLLSVMAGVAITLLIYMKRKNWY